MAELKGWICSYRSIWSQTFFKGNGMRVAVWHWLLHHAAWEQSEHDIFGEKITINRGEVCFSQQQISDDTGATRKQVRDVIEYLIKRGKGTKIGANERANKGANVRANAKSVLIIEKYDEYQVKKEAGANGGASKGAAKGPIKNNRTNKQTTSNEVVSAILSEIAGPEIARAFIAHRKDLKKPITENGAGAIAKKLEGHHDPGAVLTDSIANGWQGVFPDKIKPQFKAINGGQNGQGSKPNSQLDTIALAARARRSPGANRS